jgi:hypothetical protein
MLRKHQNMIYSLQKNDELSLDNIDFNKSIDNKIYTFEIKMISTNSELLHNFRLSVDTECLFVFNTLYIVEENLSHNISDLANGVYFLKPENIKESDLMNVYEYIKNSDWIKSRIKLFKLFNMKRENMLFFARLYLFEKKVNEVKVKDKFENMMLKSRRIISKFKSSGKTEKDIDYLLLKGFH